MPMSKIITISHNGVEYNEISSNIKVLFFTKIIIISNTAKLISFESDCGMNRKD